MISRQTSLVRLLLFLWLLIVHSAFVPAASAAYALCVSSAPLEIHGDLCMDKPPPEEGYDVKMRDQIYLSAFPIQIVLRNELSRAGSSVLPASADGQGGKIISDHPKSLSS